MVMSLLRGDTQEVKIRLGRGRLFGIGYECGSNSSRQHFLHPIGFAGGGEGPDRYALRSGEYRANAGARRSAIDAQHIPDAICRSGQSLVRSRSNQDKEAAPAEEESNFIQLRYCSGCSSQLRKSRVIGGDGRRKCGDLWNGECAG